MGSSTTTRNFGIRRFTNLVREARFRAPVGVDLRLGTAVEVDPASLVDPQEIRQVPDGSAWDLAGGGAPGRVVGALWYEHDSQVYEGQAAGSLRQDNNFAEQGRMVQILHGAGVKFWFRNTEAATPEAGLHFPNTRSEVIMVANLGHHGTGDLAVGTLLAWDAANTRYAATLVADEALMRVTYVDNTLGVCDAEMIR